MGKQDMSDEFAKRWANTYQNTTEAEARDRWDQEIWSTLSSILTNLMQSEFPITPITCPKCGSFKITSTFSRDELVCYACGGSFIIKDYETPKPVEEKQP